MALDGIAAIVASTDWVADHSNEVVCVLYGYFDDSGTHDDAQTAVMAGYVAHEADWRRFEVKSKKLFDSEGIEYFHAKLFKPSVKQFTGWSTERKLRFASRWFQHANRHVMRGISAGMKKSDFRSAKKMDRKLPGITCSAYCMQMAIRHLCSDAEVWSEIEKYGLHIIVESSAVADEGIRTDFNRVVAANDLGKHLRSIAFVPKKSSRALQLGDYLAHFSQQFAETAIEDSLDGITPFLDIAKEQVQTIFKLGEKFAPNPAFRAALLAAKRRGA